MCLIFKTCHFCGLLSSKKYNFKLPPCRWAALQKFRSGRDRAFIEWLDFLCALDINGQVPIMEVLYVQATCMTEIYLLWTHKHTQKTRGCLSVDKNGIQFPEWNTFIRGICHLLYERHTDMLLNRMAGWHSEGASNFGQYWCCYILCMSIDVTVVCTFHTKSRTG